MTPSPKNKAIVYIVVVLILSGFFTAYVFANPERMWLFNRVMFVPGLSALAMRIIEKQSLSDIFKPLISRVDLQSVAFAVLYPLIVIATCAFAAFVLGLATLDTSKLNALTPHLTVFAVFVVMGEEYGWRGYLLPTLRDWVGPRMATIIVGLVWAVWHGPLLFLLAKHLDTAEPVTLCLIQMAAVFVIAFPFSYVYFRTGSVLPAMILHYVWNDYNPVVLGNLYRNQPGLLVGDILTINGEGVLGVIVGTLAGIWFIRHLDGQVSSPSHRE
jgi:uncharacterized protein